MWFINVLCVLLLCILAYVLFLGICALCVSPDKEYENHSRFYRRLLNGFTAIALKLCRVRIHVTGLEKLPKDTKKLLFVCNHRSKFDPIVTWYALKDKDIAFISKPENFKIPVFGRLIRKCCFLPIDRENPRNALRTIHKAAKLLKRSEVSVGIYPEGTRNPDGQLLPFHNGVFKIAQRAEAPIVVLTVRGTEKVHKNVPLHHTDVYLNVAEVLPTATVTTSKTEELGSQIRQIMTDNIEK